MPLDKQIYLTHVRAGIVNLWKKGFVLENIFEDFAGYVFYKHVGLTGRVLEVTTTKLPRDFTDSEKLSDVTFFKLGPIEGGEFGKDIYDRFGADGIIDVKKGGIVSAKGIVVGSICNILTFGSDREEINQDYTIATLNTLNNTEDPSNLLKLVCGGKIVYGNDKMIAYLNERKKMLQERGILDKEGYRGLLKTFGM